MCGQVPVTGFGSTSKYDLNMMRKHFLGHISFYNWDVKTFSSIKIYFV